MPAIPALAVAAIGAGASMYGANKAAKAQNAANAANQQIAAEANRYNYQMWLESQGVGPNGQPVNVRLPRYMYAQVGQKRRLVPKGTAASSNRITAAVTNPAMSVAPSAQAPVGVGDFANAGMYA